MDFQSVLMDIGKNALAVGVVQLVNVVDKVPVQRTEMTQRLKQGATYTLARDLVDYMTIGNSNLLNMQYRPLVDSTVWNGTVGYAADKTGVADRLEDVVSGFSPFEYQVNNALVDGAIMTLSNTIRGMAEVNPLVMQTPVRYLLQPTSLIM